MRNPSYKKICGKKLNVILMRKQAAQITAKTCDVPQSLRLAVGATTSIR